MRSTIGFQTNYSTGSVKCAQCGHSRVACADAGRRDPGGPGAGALPPLRRVRGRGGELIFLVPAEPPSYTPPRETFAVVATPAARTTTRCCGWIPRPDGTRIFGDLAECVDGAADGPAYTVRILWRAAASFLLHTGSDLTARELQVELRQDLFPSPARGHLESQGEYLASSTVTARLPRSVHVSFA